MGSTMDRLRELKRKHSKAYGLGFAAVQSENKPCIFAQNSEAMQLIEGVPVGLSATIIKCFNSGVSDGAAFSDAMFNSLIGEV